MVHWATIHLLEGAKLYRVNSFPISKLQKTQKTEVNRVKTKGV